ncbi:MAG: fumarylacetoacetate hydrolase family protein [Formivibrio sp.]|nr:fumarylacetoacetate hydrolase family protein [Formivibrio sp.]
MRTIQIGQNELAVSNIYCVATNYVAHAVEMGAKVAESPIFFMKPTTAIVPPGQPIPLPAWSQSVHHEVEVVVAIGKDGVDVRREDALSYIAGYAIGLDMTARDIQAELKKAGRPWALAKGYRGSAVLSEFIPASLITDPADIDLSLEVNGQVRQQGNTRHLVFGIAEIIVYVSQRFGLQAGDLIYTGTPEGVGQVLHGDSVTAKLGSLITDTRQVV